MCLFKLVVTRCDDAVYLDVELVGFLTCGELLTMIERIKEK